MGKKIEFALIWGRHLQKGLVKSVGFFFPSRFLCFFFFLKTSFWKNWFSKPVFLTTLIPWKRLLYVVGIQRYRFYRPNGLLHHHGWVCPVSSHATHHFVEVFAVANRRNHSMRPNPEQRLYTHFLFFVCSSIRSFNSRCSVADAQRGPMSRGVVLYCPPAFLFASASIEAFSIDHDAAQFSGLGASQQFSSSPLSMCTPPPQSARGGSARGKSIGSSSSASEARGKIFWGVVFPRAKRTFDHYRLHRVFINKKFPPRVHTKQQWR